ncbi:MAG TPA: hypothetical protein VGS41_11640 [Chthonomonadales bacterium]|nr:hypothetical protein [Chthonomonadales bacterium]
MRGLRWYVAGAQLLISISASAGPTGLNIIPTTDIVPFHSWIGQIQNSNTSFQVPAFYSAPDAILQSQFSLSPTIEAGVDYFTPPQADHSEPVFNIKALLLSEDEYRPNAAIGIWNVGLRQPAGYYITLSKTLNYAQEQFERFRAHHRRNRKLLGRRIHAGLAFDGHGAVAPFLGTDLQLNENSVFQADWISGSGNAISFGLAYVFPDQRTVLNPAILFSNNKQRVDGFILSLSHQFNL